MNYDILAVDNVMAIIDELQDIRQYNRDFRWVQRLGHSNALDGEILAKYKGRIFAADILTYNSAAVIRAARPIRLEQTAIPTLKHGLFIDQENLAVLDRIAAGNANRQDNNIFEDYLAQSIIDLVDGVRARMEALITAMLIDNLTYNHLGVAISGLSWGMPSDLKVTPSTLWTDATNADPVNDIMTVVVLAQQKYGVKFNRITMSYQAFQYMVLTQSFRNKAQVYSQVLIPGATSFPVNDVPLMIKLASMILGMAVEFDDRQSWVQHHDGTEQNFRYLPQNVVLLTTTDFDGDRSAMDWANALVDETRPGIVPGMIGQFEGQQYGPVGYTTAASLDGNPPGLILWGAGRGFPRKKMLASSAALTVF